MSNVVSLNPTPNPMLEDEAKWRELSARRLREARQAKHWYLKDLSARCPDFWSVSRLGGYEQGIRAMSVPVMATLSRVLGVSPAWMAGLEGTMGFSTDETDLLLRYQRSPDNVKALVRQVLDLHAPTIS